MIGERRYLKVRELVAEGEIIVKWVDTKNNLSDLLTKGTFTPEQFDALKGGPPCCRGALALLWLHVADAIRVDGAAPSPSCVCFGAPCDYASTRYAKPRCQRGGCWAGHVHPCVLNSVVTPS